MATFGERFKNLRKEKGLTQPELAKIFHTTKSSISKYENNKSLPEVETLKEYADYFKVSIDYLLGKTDIKNPSMNIPEGVQKYLNDEENQFLIDLLQKDDFHMFLREARGASDKDLATAVRVFKAVKEGTRKGDKLGF